jgi:RimJ/RimL family protein N-acetyltransferase
LPLEPVSLIGARVALVPLTLERVPGLLAAATVSRATYTLTGVPDTAEAMREYVDAALELHRRGEALPFATLDRQSDRVVGSTRFGNIERWRWPPAFATKQRQEGIPDAVEIGWTWLAADAQRTAINTEAKLLMLTHAFETWRVQRVALRTDARNARSRAAIERLGAKLDGILRAHMPAHDGEVRSTASYSIVASEWSDVRRHLTEKLRK